MAVPRTIDDLASVRLTRALEIREAQLAEALDSVQALVALLRKQGGYTTSDQQTTIRGARALLAEHGRTL